MSGFLSGRLGYLRVLVTGLVVYCVVAAKPELLAEREYEGFRDESPSEYRHVEALIDYQNTVIGTETGCGVSVWCGFDNGKRNQVWTFLQSGWKKQLGTGTEGVMYHEYVDEVQGWEQVWYGTPPPNARYGVMQAGSEAWFMVDDMIMASLAWSCFDDARLCHAQYGTEIHNPATDSVPGSSDAPIEFAEIYVRLAATETLVLAPLAQRLSGATNGDSEKTGAGRFQLWDTRD